MIFKVSVKCYHPDPQEKIKHIVDGKDVTFVEMEPIVAGEEWDLYLKCPFCKKEIAIDLNPETIEE
jgi:hypothetical protein